MSCKKSQDNTHTHTHTRSYQDLDFRVCKHPLEVVSSRTRYRETCRSPRSVPSVDTPWSQRQSLFRSSRGTETSRSSPQSQSQSDCHCWDREPCRIARAVSNGDSPWSQVEWHRHCRGREDSRFVVWSRLWTSFVVTFHFLFFTICLGDRQQKKGTYCTHTGW